MNVLKWNGIFQRSFAGMLALALFMSLLPAKTLRVRAVQTDDAEDVVSADYESGEPVEFENSIDYTGKTIAFYGDSVVAQTNGDWTEPFTSLNWATLVGKYFSFDKVYSRGIGGQTYRWGNGGGSVSFVDEKTGLHKSRIDGTSYDEYMGEIEEGLIKTRGSACSYHRIASMFPESIAEEIDYVFVIYHNDASQGTKLDGETALWEEGSTLDPEWAASTYYAEYGGDYNIATTAGAIASTIMKLRAVLPNAKIILGTPISGRGSTGVLNPGMDDDATVGTLALRNLVMRTAEEFSVPCVDVYGTCGINGLNRTEYITDGIHPNRFGGEMLARGIIGGFKRILAAEQKSDWNGKKIVTYADSDGNEPICSYERILSVFDQSVCEEIDCVVLNFENSSVVPGVPVWESRSVADAAWAASEQFSIFGGDYDLSNKAGQIASAIMKLQAVLPNAVIVFALPDDNQTELRELVRQTAITLSIPCVDTYDTDNIAECLNPIVPKFSKTSFGESISGTTSFAHATVSVAAQGIYGFEPGKIYEYAITPDYDGKISLYYAYKDATRGASFSVITSAMALSSIQCTAGETIMGKITIPDGVDNPPVDFVVIRTYTGDQVSVDYTFTKGHFYSDSVTPPTCTEQGYTTYTCRCGDSYKADYVAAKGHTEVIDKAVAATCTASGKTEGKHCSVCHAVLVAQKVVPALGHTVVTDKAVAATCTESGLTEGKHCSVCHAVLAVQQIVPAKGHTEVVDAAVAPTCTAAGKTAGKHCSVCNVILVPQQSVAAKGHVWDNGVVTKQPTETAEGEKKFTCSACGETKLQSVPALRHTHKYEKSVTAPTCTEEGYTTYTCRCGDTYKADYVAAKGHTEVIDKAVNATCTESGLTEGKHCGVCNAILVPQQVIPAKGHVWDNPQDDTCNVCGEKREVEKPEEPEEPEKPEKRPTVSGKVDIKVSGKASVSIVTSSGKTEGSVNDDGSFSLPAAEGAFDVVVKKAGCLTYTVKNVTVESGNITLPEIELVRGDTNGDDMINIMDMGAFRANFGKVGTNIANAFTDVNGDGMVNIMDMGTFRANFGKTAAKDCTITF